MDAWQTYVRATLGTDTQSEAARRIGVPQSTVSRWMTTAPSVANVRALALAYRRPVLEAFVAAGFLTSSEARQQTTAAPPGPETWPNDRLVAVLVSRLVEPTATTHALSNRAGKTATHTLREGGRVHA